MHAVCQDRESDESMYEELGIGVTEKGGDVEWLNG